MNRATRRASQFKRGQRWNRNDVMSQPDAALSRIKLAQTYAPDQVARLSVDARLAWYKLTNGNGSMEDFDILAGMINTTYVIAMDADADEIVQDIFDRAMESMATMRARYERIGKFGADAQALAHVPDVLDAIDTLLANITPLQAVSALRRSMQLVEQGQVIRPACFGEAAASP
jgi:hypothetical protein